ncbi:MAG: MFS transporter [Mycobacterium sp.]|nr:MFS transporter [Mycobacterium sp.]
MTSSNPRPTADPEPADGDSLRVQRAVAQSRPAVDGPRDQVDGSAQRKSSIFTNGNFLLLWSGNAISLIGFNGVRIVYPLLALVLTGSPILASCVGFAITVPSLLFPISAGIAADYWDRRRILAACQWIGLAATLLATVPVALQPPGVWLVLPVFVVAAFVEGTAQAFSGTSEQGLTRDVVSMAQRPAAFSLIAGEQPVATVMGRALGGAALGVTPSFPFLVNAVSYLYCLWSLSRMRGTQPARPDVDAANRARVRRWDHDWTGLKIVSTERFLRATTAAVAATNAICQVVLLLIMLEIRDAGRSPTAVGLVLGATGLGGILAVLAAAWLANRVSARALFVWSQWALTVLLVPIALHTNPVLLALCWMGVGAVGATLNVTLTLYRLRIVPDHLLGRVIGATQFIANGGVAVGALCAGVVLWMFGTSTTGWILVVGMLMLAAASMRHLREPNRP